MAAPPFPRIVEDKSERTGPKAEVCVECTSLDQAYAKETRELVLTHASKIGMTKPGMSGGCSTEWVDETGAVLRGEEFKAATTRLVRAYYPVQEGL